jgi:type II secretory pathway pseudopilin PulG
LTLRTPQRGATGVLIIALIVIVMVVILATYALTRVTEISADTSQASAGLAKAAAVLEAYAAATQRLPCPADPTLDTGVELPVGVGSPDCSKDEGTLPWQTIGMRRDDAIDPWGRKLSYRVYTGNAGSLVQPGGVSMAKCDTVEPSPGGATAGGGGLGGLCKGTTDPFQYDTTPAQFLNGKGLKLTDMSAPQYDDVAYVILSHGPTGLGGYSVSGIRLDMPAGDEKKNTQATGPFTIMPFSDVDTAATSGTHFDDLLVYRRLADLVARIGLGARNWPEMAGADVSAKLDNATVAAAAGAPVTPGSGVGQTTLNFTGMRASGLGPSSTPTELSYGEVGGIGGIGGMGGLSYFLESSANEFVRLEFTDAATTFGITLVDFGTYGAGFAEKVQLVFYLDSVAVGSPYVGTACNIDGGLASFTVPVGGPFNRVDVVPIPSSDGGGGTGITAFLISEAIACVSGTCRTSLDVPANRCS